MLSDTLRFRENGSVVYVSVITSEIDFPDADTRTAVHEGKIDSLLTAMENGELGEWRFHHPPLGVPNPGKRISWRYIGAGTILRNVAYALTDDELADCQHANTERDGVSITADTTADNLGRDLTKAEMQRRNYLRRKAAKNAGFESWHNLIAARRMGTGTIQVNTLRSIHPGKSGPPSRFVGGHRND